MPHLTISAAIFAVSRISLTSPSPQGVVIQLGGTFRCCKLKAIISLNTGALVSPPQIGEGSSRTTVHTSRGFSAGANPVKVAM